MVKLVILNKKYQIINPDYVKKEFTNIKLKNYFPKYTLNKGIE